MWKLAVSVALTLGAAAGIMAAASASTPPSKAPCETALNADITAFASHPDSYVPLDTSKACKGLTAHQYDAAFRQVEQSRASDIARGQLASK